MPTYEDVIRETTVPVPLERAFAAFVGDIARWWPRVFTFSGDGLATIAIDARAGRWYERARDGTELDWGEVRAWDPPHRLVLGWRVAPDRSQEPPERASEVEVTFEPAAGGGTRVLVHHRDFARHGADWEAMRAGMASPQGWNALLDAYRARLG